MIHTIAILIPAVQFLANGGGAGVVASLAFDALRRRFPQPAVAPASRLAQFAYRAIYAPRYARISAITVASIISVICSGILAAMTGGDVISAVDVALSMAISAIASQVMHALGLSTDAPKVNDEATH